MATYTIYSETTDGAVFHIGGDWTTVRGAGTGTSVDTSGQTFITCGAFNAGFYFIYRGFLIFNTSVIAESAISSITLYVKKADSNVGTLSIRPTDNEFSTVTIQRFDYFNPFTIGSVTSSTPSGSWEGITLSTKYASSTKNTLNLSGMTMLCVQDRNCDALGSTPTDLTCFATWYSADSSDKPYIVVVTEDPVYGSDSIVNITASSTSGEVTIATKDDGITVAGNPLTQNITVS